MMNQNETVQFSKIACAITLSLVLSSCGTSKSSDGDGSGITLSSSSTTIFASCNKLLTNPDMGLSYNAVTDQSGQVDGNWLRVKFSFLSSAMTNTSSNAPTGNVIKFFKWRWNAQLQRDEQDTTPISIFDYSNNTMAQQLPVSAITSSKIFALAINDAAGRFQVIKAAVYAPNGGAALVHHDAFIPIFDAKPSSYSSTHASALQALHPLNSTSTSGWSDAQYTSYFQAFCF